MHIMERVIDVVAPHNCIICGEEGKVLCNYCFFDVATVVPSRCYLCHAATQESAVCIKCRRKTPLSHVWVCSEYENSAQKLVQAYKYERKQALAPILARFLEETLPFLDGFTVVPVPTATSRARTRGYDQAVLLAQELAKLRNLNFSLSLARVGQSRQVGSRRNERVKQVAGAFRISGGKSIAKASVLLVDDVLTTGSTLEEAARTLKKVGASKVDAIVFAQKQ